MGSFHDATLLASDIALLRDPQSWLNDSCCYLQLEVLRVERAPDDCVILPPTAALLLSSCSADELRVPASPSNLFARCASSALVLLAVTDSTLEAQALARRATGSHWSLLAAWPKQARAVHYDSMPGAPNAPHAARLAHALGLLCNTRFALDLQGACARQRNAYDCGAHMLANAAALVEGQDPLTHAASAFDVRAALLERARSLISTVGAQQQMKPAAVC